MTNEFMENKERKAIEGEEEEGKKKRRRRFPQGLLPSSLKKNIMKLECVQWYSHLEYLHLHFHFLLLLGRSSTT